MSRVAKVVITGPASRVEVDGLTLQTIVAGERELNLVNVGPPGPPGAAATVHLLGTLDNPSELPTPGSVGDGWMIDGDVWVWTAEGEWINAGPIRGPQGPPGPTEPYVRLGSNLGSPRHLGQLPVAPGGLNADDIFHIGRAISSGNPAAGVNSYGGTIAELSAAVLGNISVTSNSNGVSFRIAGDFRFQICVGQVTFASGGGVTRNVVWTFPQDFGTSSSTRVFVQPAHFPNVWEKYGPTNLVVPTDHVEIEATFDSSAW
ncbi:MAG TPA: hypothetical protein VK054_05120, partial [Beutenbergiaceae bacterium]|nr:hypothetical protein [Beutenbergiaceae bacterium]